MSLEEYPALSPGKRYVPPAERKRALQELQQEQSPEPEPAPESQRIAGRTKAEFLVEFVLSRQMGPGAVDYTVSHGQEAVAVWGQLVEAVGYDQ